MTQRGRIGKVGKVVMANSANGCLWETQEIKFLATHGEKQLKERNRLFLRGGVRAVHVFGGYFNVICMKYRAAKGVGFKYR